MRVQCRRSRHGTSLYTLHVNSLASQTLSRRRESGLIPIHDLWHLYGLKASANSVCKLGEKSLPAVRLGPARQLAASIQNGYCSAHSGMCICAVRASLVRLQTRVCNRPGYEARCARTHVCLDVCDYEVLRKCLHSTCLTLPVCKRACEIINARTIQTTPSPYRRMHRTTQHFAHARTPFHKSYIETPLLIVIYMFRSTCSLY